MKPVGFRLTPGLALIVAAVASATTVLGCTGGSEDVASEEAAPAVRASMVYYAMPG